MLEKPLEIINARKILDEKMNNDSSPTLIRRDIFLIKVQVNNIRVDHQIKDNSKQSVKEINGSASFKIIEKNPFYLSLKQFKNKFSHKHKSDEIHNENTTLTPTFTGQSLNEQFQKQTTPAQLNQQQSQEKKKKSKLPKKLSKITKQSLFRMAFSAYKNTSNPSNSVNSFSGYEQGYHQLQYKRNISSQGFKLNDTIEEKKQVQTESYIEENQIIDTINSRPNIKNLFGENDLLIFSGTQESVFELQFEEQDLNSNQSKISSLQKSGKSKNQQSQNLNVFWAKFRLKNFSNIPFTQHQVAVKLYQKPKEREKEKKQSLSKEKINFEVDLSFFFVPGNTNGWGVLKINETAINWKDIGTKTKTQKKFLKIRLQFPDVIERNKRMVQKQLCEVETKVQEVDSNENPVWTEDIFIRINPQRNKVRILFLQMEKNKTEIKSIVGQKTINLLEEGFLFDKVESTRHILLQSKKSENSDETKVTDMIINFCFDMSISDEVAPLKLTSSKNNAFVNNFGGFL